MAARYRVTTVIRQAGVFCLYVVSLVLSRASTMVTMRSSPPLFLQGLTIGKRGKHGADQQTKKEKRKADKQTNKLKDGQTQR